MLAASDIVIGLVDECDRFIAFTRVLSDFIYRATIYDVIVKPSHRSMGLGGKLMDTIVNHPKLQSVEMLILYCLPEMINFYERWGFTADVGEIHLMFCTNKFHNTYSSDEKYVD